MRIRFLKDVVVDPLAMPERARGAIMLRKSGGVPIADPATGSFVMQPDGPLQHVFPRGRVTEMDDAVADILIGNGEAEYVTSDRGDVVWCEDSDPIWSLT